MKFYGFVSPGGFGSPYGPITNPTSLQEEYTEVDDGNDIQLHEVRPSSNATRVFHTREELASVAQDLLTSSFDGPGLTPVLFRVQEKLVQMWIARTGCDPNRDMPPLPTNSNLVLPAIDCILAWTNLLLDAYDKLFTPEELVYIKMVRELLDGYNTIIDIFAPILQGATINKIQALTVLADFCTRVDKNGRAAIDRDFTLNRKMQPLRDFINANAKQAAETLHTVQTAKHEAEAETLDRVKTAIANANQGATAQTAVPGSPVVGAHAPGQTPVPAGALPLSVVPEPIHKKPARRVGSKTKPGSGPAPKTGPSPRPSPRRADRPPHRPALAFLSFYLQFHPHPLAPARTVPRPTEWKTNHHSDRRSPATGSGTRSPPIRAWPWAPSRTQPPSRPSSRRGKDRPKGAGPDEQAAEDKQMLARAKEREAERRRRQELCGWTTPV